MEYSHLWRNGADKCRLYIDAYIVYIIILAKRARRVPDTRSTRNYLVLLNAIPITYFYPVANLSIAKRRKLETNWQLQDIIMQ